MVFMASAFEPTDDELRDFARKERSRGKRGRRDSSPPPVSRATSVMDIDSIELSDSDDDDMPASVSQILQSAAQKSQGR